MPGDSDPQQNLLWFNKEDLYRKLAPELTETFGYFTSFLQNRGVIPESADLDSLVAERVKAELIYKLKEISFTSPFVNFPGASLIEDISSYMQQGPVVFALASTIPYWTTVENIRRASPRRQAIPVYGNTDGLIERPFNFRRKQDIAVSNMDSLITEHLNKGGHAIVLYDEQPARYSDSIEYQTKEGLSVSLNQVPFKLNQLGYPLVHLIPFFGAGSIDYIATTFKPNESWDFMLDAVTSQLLDPTLSPDSNFWKCISSTQIENYFK